MAKLDLKGALKVLADAMSGRASGGETAKTIDLVKLGKELVANEKLSAKQYELIQAMDEEQQGMVKVLLEAMLTKAADEAMPPEDDEMAKAAAAKAAAAQAAAAAPPVATNKDKNGKGGDEDNTALAKKLDAFLTNLSTKVDGLVTEVASLKTNQGKAVAETIKRNELIERLVANEAKLFERADLEGMTTDVLTKLESKLRPADYSGQGQFASNASSEGGEGVEAPMVANASSFFLRKPDKKVAGKGKEGERAAA